MRFKLPLGFSVVVMSLATTAGGCGSSAGSAFSEAAGSSSVDGSTDAAGSAGSATDENAAALSVCSSMTTWTGGNRESPLMRPGGACISCHQQSGDGPIFSVAGTVFPTLHEPDDCNGAGSATGAQVVVTDGAGVAHTLTVNDVGNFSLEAKTFALPYRAKVVYQGREQLMAEAQTSGDCNNCHTQNGREKAPGRIFLP